MSYRRYLRKRLRRAMRDIVVTILLRFDNDCMVLQELINKKDWIVLKKNKSNLKEVDRRAYDKQIKAMKGTIHFYLDYLWRNGFESRSGIYKEIGELLGVSTSKAHISKINDLYQLKEVLKFVKNLREEHLMELRESKLSSLKRS